MKHKITSPIFLLGVLAFLLSGMPKVRMQIGMPIYLVDLIILFLVLTVSKKKRPRFTGRARKLQQIISVYFVFMVLGELRGMVVYNKPFESLYVLFRVSMAWALPFIIPRIVRSVKELTVVIKGLCVGLTLSATLSVLYSVPFTRGLTHFIFSIKMINPVDKSAAFSSLKTLRGNTLIGTSTFSSGLMAMLWPLLYTMKPLLGRTKLWAQWGKYALMMLPLGILATYGRTAWLSVVLIFSTMLLWGSGKSRAQTAFWVIVSLLIVVQVGIESEFLMVDRVISKTQKTFKNPLEGDSERERFLAYVEPFQHVVEFPSFLIAGTGVARNRIGGNAYRESKMATHAVPAIAYYSYGVGGALCHIYIFFAAGRLCFMRLKRAQKKLPGLVWIWRALMGAWFGLLPWWLFAHGIVTQPRGAMAYFLFIGIILACERIYMREESLAGVGVRAPDIVNEEIVSE